MDKEQAIAKLREFEELLAVSQDGVKRAEQGILRIQGYIACLNDLQAEENADGEDSTEDSEATS